MSRAYHAGGRQHIEADQQHPRPLTPSRAHRLQLVLFEATISAHSLYVLVTARQLALYKIPCVYNVRAP